MPDLMTVMPKYASIDPVGKIRVSQPQALIDTDFEYGQQPTKWESIGLQQNRASCYYISQQPRVVTAVTGDGTTRTVVVSMADTTGFSIGSLIYVQNSNDPNANGWFMVSAVTASTSVSYVATGIVANGDQYNNTKTYVYLGYFYSSSGIAVGSNAITNSGTTCTATTTYPHGLGAGSLIYISGTTATTNAPNGAWVVATTPTNTTFTFTVISTPTGTITNSANQTTIYARPNGYVEPRTFDGGVAFSSGPAAPNQQLIRQTRRYFRYQSGKGIQVSTGTSLNPTLMVSSITSSFLTATVTTQFAHSLAAGATIVVSGCDQSQYNGTFTVATVPTLNTLTYTMGNVASVSPATGLYQRVNPTNWYGSSNRMGLFDQQNGMFFEYDGQTLYAVQRASTAQISGTVTVTQGQGNVTGSGTQFTTQLAVGDFIVIRGQSYRVINIASNTSLFISPEYRGSTISSPSGAIVSKTVDTRIPRSQWLDPLDGTGASGYVIDLTRMQMWYIDYSWYGAGYIRWGLRTTNGEIIYVYQQTNNNVKYEAYMRSGNLPAHYESNGLLPATTLTATLASGATTGGTINVVSTAGFAPSGTLRVQASGSGGAIEHITYSSKTATTFVINSRAVTGGAGSAQTFTYSASAPISVEYATPDTAAAISHWGTSVIMDGNFNDDKSLIFNYGTTTAVSTSSTTPVVLMAIRIAPAVDNGKTALLGAKEIINRMQLQLVDLGIVTTGNTYLINLILNGYASGATSGAFITPIQQTNGISSSLAQIAVNTNAVNVTGGESVAAAYCNANGVTTLDLSQVRDLGNSILGGGTSTAVPTSQSNFYPDGPDIIYVVAQAVSATAGTVLARLSWKEAQA
jgi:hypothetical protein